MKSLFEKVNKNFKYYLLHSMGNVIFKNKVNNSLYKTTDAYMWFNTKIVIVKLEQSVKNSILEKIT
jgi:hypothetical protein